VVSGARPLGRQDVPPGRTEVEPRGDAASAQPRSPTPSVSAHRFTPACRVSSRPTDNRGVTSPEALLPLVLASASPRRADLLQAAGFTFTVAHADIDETPSPDEPADRYVLRLAEAKARAVAAQFLDGAVLGADTTVVVDGDILGKPTDAHDAAAMLRRLQGRSHEVMTGVALVARGAARVELATTRVWFAPMTEHDIAAYVASGEPMDKAGAYGIQGRAARYVTRIDGSYSNVVGLPVAIVHALVREILPVAAENPRPGGAGSAPAPENLSD
jgi:septum formation protein